MEGKIYKITGGGLTYYGSTIRDLETRFNGHKNDYKKFKQGKKAGCSTSWKVLEHDDAKIELVETIIYNKKTELLSRETHFIRNNECVNKAIPISENHEKNREYQKRHSLKKVEKERMEWYRIYKEQMKLEENEK